MSKDKQLPYFCFQCHEVLVDINQSYVLEQKSGKCFCSEECIIKFHKPYLHFFQRQEMTYRENLSLVEEPFHMPDEEQYLWIEKATESPDEVWQQTDALGVEYFSLLKKCGMSNDSYWLVLVCYLFAHKPSFIFHHLFSKEKKLLDLYRWQAPALNKGVSSSSDRGISSEHVASLPEESEQVHLTKTTLQQIELLRSQLLSELIEVRSEKDIALEQFGQYEKYLAKTLNKPTEIFEHTNLAKQKIIIHISDHNVRGKTFFYYVICWQIPDDELPALQVSKGKPVLVPVLGFPSTDQQIYQHYRRGHCVSKRAMN